MPSNLRPYKETFPHIGENAYVDPSAQVIGDVVIGNETSIWPLVVARGDVNHIRIGHRSNIQDASILHVTHKNKDNPNGFPLIIGDDVTIGHKVMLHGCIINDRVLVGMGSTVLDGVIIHSDVMIGAASLVPPNKILESGYLYFGCPVKKVRLLTEKERTYLLTSAKNYVMTKDNYLAYPNFTA